MSMSPVGGTTSYRRPPKRKLEELCEVCASPPIRRNSISNFAGNSVIDSRFQSILTGNSECKHVNSDSTNFEIQFFVRMLSGETLVMRANLEDTVETVHRRISERKRIGVDVQRLLYNGKQLQLQDTLKNSKIKNDAMLHLVGRMQSTDYPKVWRILCDLNSIIGRICKKELPFVDPCPVKYTMQQFMALRLDQDISLKVAFGRQFYHEKRRKLVQSGGIINKYDFCQIFMDACAPQSLIALYMLGNKIYKECAEECIKSFVAFVKAFEGTWIERAYCAKPVLEFCKSLRMMVKEDDHLYIHCRSVLGSMLAKVEMIRWPKDVSDVHDYVHDYVVGTDVFPFVKELGQTLLKDLVQSVESDSDGPLYRDVCDFSALLQPVLSLIGMQPPAAANSLRTEGKYRLVTDVRDHVRLIFTNFLSWVDKGLHKVKLSLFMKKKKGVVASTGGWSQYLAILKILHSISHFYPGSQDIFWTTVRQHKTGVCSLILNYAERADDNSWLLQQRDILDFDSRRHLSLLLFPEVKEDYGDMLEMLIDRSNLLAESFEYMHDASSSSLHAGIFMQFKEEVATGPGVLREWFCLVCQAIFNPLNALFVSCPSDRRRFSPSPASKVHPQYLEYFKFSGRVVALALMYKIQVGVVLDRVFFLQLAGRHVSVEDIRDADPFLYGSCKQILEMDAAFVDSDVLGLTFVTEEEELGARKVVELCDGGKDIAVNSKNRKKFVDLNIKHRFVTSVAEQVSYFASGFSDIIGGDNLKKTFFEILELEDLDWMLHGSESEICVQDWMSHTEYTGFRKTDPQIIWFWEVVETLNAQQKKMLLFFWTSLKYLPVEGFRGLASRLYICNSKESEEFFPSSHTCFYQLCIPPYPSKDIMQQRLLVITQEHVSCSFGSE